MNNCTCTFIAHAPGIECEIEFCPLHDAAEAMYDALTEFLNNPNSMDAYTLTIRALDKADGK